MSRYDMLRPRARLLLYAISFLLFDADVYSMSALFMPLMMMFRYLMPFSLMLMITLMMMPRRCL